MKLLFTKMVLIIFLISACSVSQSSTTDKEGIKGGITTTTISPPTEGIEVGDIAPDIVLVGLDGKEYKLSDFRGQVVFLNFWASWCAPCRAEMPSMERAYQDLKDEGLIIIAVDVGENKDTVTEFMQEFGLTFPAFLDEDKSIFRTYNKSNGIPQSYIIDREGIIHMHIPGSIDWDTITARSILDKILRIKND